MSASPLPFPKTEAPGSVSHAPHLPAGFAATFSSHFVTANGIRQHVVVGGDGPPVLLVHGWPENWYAWRHVMPDLARHYTVVAVDQRGMGLTDKPRGRVRRRHPRARPGGADGRAGPRPVRTRRP